MNKKAIFTIVVIFSGLKNFAQIDFGLKGGLNMSNLTDRVSNSWRPGFNAGVMIQKNIDKKFFVRPEFLYSVKGYKFGSSIYNSGGTLSLNYFNIPILLGFRPGEKMSLLLGPEIGFLSSAKSRFNGGSVDVSANFKKFDIGAVLGAAYNFNKKLGAEIRYVHGFKKLLEGQFTDQNGNIIGSKSVAANRVFQAGVFYLLK